MTSLHIRDSDIGDFTGRTSVITGGASGIGLATARILAAHGSKVHVLDISDPHDEDGPNSPLIIFHRCNVASWPELLSVFSTIGVVHVAIANAGVSQIQDYFADDYDGDGLLREPEYPVLDVNFKAVLNFVKLSLSNFKRHGPGGSLVITSSATGLFPEQSLPVYSACKAGVIGLVRALRASLPYTHGATINAIAPAATITRLLSEHFAAPIKAAGLPVSSAHHVGLAVAYSANARHHGPVEAYGKDPPESLHLSGRWNGRTILTLGDTYTEVEEPLATLRPAWAGRYQSEMTALQQAMTDFRPMAGSGIGTVATGADFGHPAIVGN